MKFVMQAVCSSLFAGILCPHAATAQQPYRVEQRWAVPGDGSWDYLLADAPSHRLYIAHGTRVSVVDTNDGHPVGAIEGLTRCHGIVLAPDGKTGFISDGGANHVVVFDTGTLASAGTIPAGTNPDGMVYERSTGTLWVFNGTSKNATVVDVAKRSVVATIALPGKPEFPASDDRGTVFVNIEDTNQIVRLDAVARKITATWKLSSCESPSGLAIDIKGSRLFSVCDGQKMAVTDSKTGKLLASPAIGDGPDAVAFDPGRNVIFSSNGEGTMTLIDGTSYGVIQTLPTMKGARTMAFDAAKGKAYTVTGKLGPAPAPTAAVPHPRPVTLPGSFTVLVVGRD